MCVNSCQKVTCCRTLPCKLSSSSNTVGSQAEYFSFEETPWGLSVLTIVLTFQVLFSSFLERFSSSVRDLCDVRIACRLTPWCHCFLTFRFLLFFMVNPLTFTSSSFDLCCYFLATSKLCLIQGRSKSAGGVCRSFEIPVILVCGVKHRV